MPDYLMALMNINLKRGGANKDLNPVFKHATDGTNADFTTQVSVGTNSGFLTVRFLCEDNPFSLQNSMKIHNEPLYNQEVFEIFISAGADDPKSYFEIEINPNNAVWIGEIANPELGEGPQRIVRQMEPAEVGLKHGAEIFDGCWSGFLNIPWELLGESTDYRINFYRIRSKVSHPDPDWECDAATCDFVCWSSTLSGAEPAFHRPKRFGHLKVNG